jgi:hypothetical protein
MAFSEIELQRIKAIVEPFCARRSPAHVRQHVRTEYRVKGQDVLIVEVRIVWDDPIRWVGAGKSINLVPPIGILAYWLMNWIAIRTGVSLGLTLAPGHPMIASLRHRLCFRNS